MKQYLYPVIIGIAAIISVLILASAYKYRFISAETISVTGLAEKDFTSDLIVWKGSFTRNSMVLKTAYASLKGG